MNKKMTDIEVLEKKWNSFIAEGEEEPWLWRYSAAIRRIGKKVTKELWIGVHIINNETHPHHDKWLTYTVPLDFWPSTYHDTLEDAKREAERQVEEMIQEVREGKINWWTRYNKCPYCGKYHCWWHNDWRNKSPRCLRHSTDDFRHRWRNIPDGIDHDWPFEDVDP